jgi:hypothetical protein
MMTPPFQAATESRDRVRAIDFADATDSQALQQKTDLLDHLVGAYQ